MEHDDKNHEIALDLYIFLTDHAQESIARIQEFLDDHGEIGPDDVDFGHVEFMRSIEKQLTDIRHKIDKTGEYAE